MIIFPAWLSHYVEENRSQQNRVSISMNAKLIPKQAVHGIKISPAHTDES
jgi:Putative 2OG-Fe(II) oxygenase